jgi:hypothetical protein
MSLPAIAPPLTSKDFLASLLFIYFVLVIFRKKALSNSFKVCFLTNKSSLELRSSPIGRAILVQFFFLSLFLYLSKHLLEQEKSIMLAYPLKAFGIIFGLLIIKFFLDFFLLKRFKDSAIERYVLLKEKSRLLLAFVFLIPTFCP